MSAKTILLAEHEPDVSAYVEQALQADGYLVKIVRDGGELLRAARNNGIFGAVLLDLSLAGEDGLELLRELRRVQPRLPVVALSGGASAARIVETLKSGANDFLVKPLTHEHLLRATRVAAREAEEAPAAAPQAADVTPANPRMSAIRSALRQVALSDVPVVLRGESGVGKEVLAREIHAQSPRATRPFLKINCAALPPELLESELFGYERGAFTGAMKSTPGKFEVADGGMILLDEIGDMDVKLQAKLLHVLQDGEFQPLGGRETVRVNVRVLAATHCDLERAIQEKRFREDLYYRLNVISIHVPPLRERKDEILPLTRYFLEKHALLNATVPEITPALREALLAHPWPGNIRELENIIRKLLVFCDSDAIAQELRQRTATAAAVAEACAPAADAHGERCHHGSVLEKMVRDRNQEEADAIAAVLNQTHWNRRRAAELLKIDYKSLIYKLKKLGIGPYQQRTTRPRRRKPTTVHQGGD